MNDLLWAIPAGLIALLLIKVYFLYKAADEIGEGFAQRLENETNTLITISSRDRHMLKLAQRINTQLKKLREQRWRYQQGDAELKNAITGISHDLRTPLTAISGYLELLEREKDPETAQKYIAIIKDRSQALTQLSEELFKYSLASTGQQELQMKSLSLNSVLEESLASFYTALNGRGIRPEISMPEEQVMRCLDKASLRRIFENILSNAVKYSDGDLNVRLDLNGGICFENSAASLGTVQAERLFERFYTVESARKSTGLGLSIARVLTERMGGQISAEYSSGRLKITVSFEKETK